MTPSFLPDPTGWMGKTLSHTFCTCALERTKQTLGRELLVPGDRAGLRFSEFLENR